MTAVAGTLGAMREAALPAACPVCRGPLGEHRGGVCAACWREVVATGGRQRRPWRLLESLTTLGPYQGRLRRIIRCCKYRDLPGLAGPLGEKLAVRVTDLEAEVDLVIPVPLHPWRRWRRGYNQAELLASVVARTLCRPMDRSGLRKSRLTRSQAGRGRRARVASVRGTFRAAGHGLRGARILLVDDVVTTGATIRECARALTAAGARVVHAAAPARTLSRTDTLR